MDLPQIDPCGSRVVQICEERRYLAPHTGTLRSRIAGLIHQADDLACQSRERDIRRIGDTSPQFYDFGAQGCNACFVLSLSLRYFASIKYQGLRVEKLTQVCKYMGALRRLYRAPASVYLGLAIIPLSEILLVEPAGWTRVESSTFHSAPQ